MKLRLSVFLSAVLVSVAFRPAGASLLPRLETISAQGNGTFNWVYQVHVAEGSHMSSSGVPPVAGVNPTDDTGAVKDYLTFYDFHGLVNPTPGEGITLRSYYPLGSTPAGVAGVPDSSATNVTVYLTDGAQASPYFFMAITSNTDASVLGYFTSETTFTSHGNTGINTVGRVPVPAVPEPAAAVAFALCAGLGMMRRRRA